MKFQIARLSAMLLFVALCMEAFSFDFNRDTVNCTDHIYEKNMKTVRFHLQEWEVSYPVMELYGDVGLEFSFDQIESQPLDYYYTVMHCTYDWKPSNIMFVEYADGFEENEIRNYEESQNTYVQYTHFSLNLPNDDLTLKLSGNYLLIVFVKEPVEKIVCTKRFMVYENIVEVTGQVSSNVLGEYKKEFQKTDFVIKTKKYPIYNPLDELKVTLVQNFQFDEAYTEMQPSFIDNNAFTFNWEDKYLFNAGNEYRYFNFNNLEINSEYVENIEYHKPYYYIDLVYLALLHLGEQRVNAFEGAACESNLAVLLHSTGNDIRFAYEVCYIGVLGFVIDIDRSSDLLDNSVLHDDDSITHRECFFLIVRYIYESDAELSLHLLKLDLHLLTHLKVKSSERLVEEKYAGSVDNSSCDSDSLHLTA